MPTLTPSARPQGLTTLGLQLARTAPWLAASVSAIVAGFAPAAPTGRAGWDFVLKAVLAGVITLAGARAPRWVTTVFGTIAAAFAGISLWLLPAAAALLLTIATSQLARRDRLFGALAAGLSVQTLLRLPAFGFFGLSSLVAGLAMVLLCSQSYRYMPTRGRRIVRRTALGVTLVTILIVGVGATNILGARGDLEQGLAAARRGLNAAQDADTAAVQEELAFARNALRSGQEQVDGTMTSLLRFVPVAAQHYEALSVSTDIGANILDAADQVIEEADIDSVSLTAGSVDLGALRDMVPALDEMQTVLANADESIEVVQSGWLIPPLAERINELDEEIARVAPEVTVARDAAALLPGMLGADEVRRYFVILGTPAESRELGGLLGSWALIDFDNGSFDLVDAGRISNLYDLVASNELSPGVYPEWFYELARPIQFPQNLTSSPDFRVVAEAAREAFSGLGGRSIDGFVYLDAWTLVELLQLTGPLNLPIRDEPLTTENAPTFFFDEQYRISERRYETYAILEPVLAAAVDRLGEVTLPGPEALGRILGPSARAGRLQVVTWNEEENDFLRSTQLLRDFEFTPGSDFMALVQTNGTAAKLDLYLHRDVHYSVDVADNGDLNARVRVDLTQSNPPDAPEFALGPGSNTVLLSLYSPHLLQEVLVDGVPHDFEASIEFGYPRYLTEVVVEPNVAPLVVEYVLTGTQPSPDYTVEVWHQPLVNNDELTITYRGPSGSIDESLVLRENITLRADQ